MAQSAAAKGDKDGQCAALIPMSFGDDVKITSAVVVPAAVAGTVADGRGGHLKSGLPAYCRVEGVINQRQGVKGVAYGIGFALALPNDWNGRFLMQGGGGLNGRVQPPYGAAAAGDSPALARGFAVVSHDSGHKGQVFDASFMADQRAALDFANSSVETVTKLAKTITTRYYGRPIAHSYMAGCSTGGREGMLASQRYPELFDGIVVGAPAMRTGFSNLGTSYAKVQFNQAAPFGDDGVVIPERAFSAADRKLILDGMLQQCDGLDGRADGMIHNVAQCTFQPAELQCKSGKQEGCLSEVQVKALKLAFAGPKDAAGAPLYSPFPYDTGVVEVSGPGRLSGFIFDGKPDILSAANTDIVMDTDIAARAVRNDAVNVLTATDTWTNLSTFLGHGGKILYYHGVSDPWFSALDTWDYWLRANDANGSEAWHNASRFYMVPGMAHCSGGNAYDSFDLLGAVVDWVEQDKAPAAVTATRNSAPNEASLICPYPAYARYDGGDAKKAASYSCAYPKVPPAGR
ncbi:MAG: tannase/feruloyl esterase family alpha/beta hydrolase [Sphingobium sp.]|nr:tannase/feruloyl esterase family alpha/beta hydrolase [Sphingobium sp.]